MHVSARAVAVCVCVRCTIMARTLSLHWRSPRIRSIHRILGAQFGRVQRSAGYSTKLVSPINPPLNAAIKINPI